MPHNIDKGRRIENLERAVEKLAEVAETGLWGGVQNEIYEILNPPDPTKFIECDTCRAKPGSPVLCQGCLHNRNLISKLSK